MSNTKRSSKLPGKKSSQPAKRGKLRSILGGWSDLKAGTRVGAGIRQKATDKTLGRATARPGRWLEGQSQKKGAEWVAARKRWFRNRYFSAIGVVLVIFAITGAVLGMKPLAIVLISIGTLSIAYGGYRQVISRVEHGKDKTK